ncbi:hypothetical protein, partial [Escherichia coli]|uniref:hypothetical protein n=1 Tax=Escherichia coli TaxID=562 RepID=UPI001CCD75A7
RDFKKYDTLFSLCYEIKPQLFKKTVAKCFLKEVIEYHESFECNYEIVPSYRKLLRELVFNNEYVLAVYKKDFIKQTYEEEWDTEIELLTKDDDKEAVKYRHFGFFFTLEYIDKYEKYNPTEITATIKEVNEYIVV